MRPVRKIGVLALLIAASTLPADAEAPIGLEARVVDVTFAKANADWAVLDFGDPADPSDDRTGTTAWRVVKRSGNCCENYVTVTSTGRLLDFGGTYLNYSDDGGESWKSVRPLEPQLSGEGAVVVAPGGDILGVGWDPYTGDHLLTYKYEAASDKWYYNEAPVHTPFYDREWITVVPGPFTIGSMTVPYISFLRGAYPSKEIWYYSIDGLNYLIASSKFVDKTLGTTTSKFLEPKVDPAADWYQPNTNSITTPLGNGVAIAAPEFFLPGATTTILDPATRRWSAFELPNGEKLTGRLLADSRGRLHEIVPARDRFTYRMSSDGGRTWSSTTAALPEGYRIEEWDFRVNGALGIGAVAVHAQGAGKDQDMAFKFATDNGTPVLARRYTVGRGDTNSTAGVGSPIRMDFQTIAILPDGRLVTSFLDSQNTNPSLAIEGATTF